MSSDDHTASWHNREAGSERGRRRDRGASGLCCRAVELARPHGLDDQVCEYRGRLDNLMEVWERQFRGEAG